MAAPVYDGEIKERATSSASLAARLDINRKYQSLDFGAWLFERIGIAEGDAVLDVGCGTGAQALRFSTLAGPSGRVCALDLSAESIAALNAGAGAGGNLTAVAGDMADLAEIVATRFPVQRFDVAHSAYALYYAGDPRAVLDAMIAALVPGGRIYVSAPVRPHGMVEFARRFSTIPEQAEHSLSFAPEVLEPHLRDRLGEVTVDRFSNQLTIPDADEVMSFYRKTTYYDPAADDRVRAAAEAQIARDGAFRYEKNGVLISGRRS